MKRLTVIFISLLFLLIKLYSAETVLLDFEVSAPPTIVGSWLNYANAGTSASVWSVDNPKKDEINMTDKSYKITKQSTDPYWIGLEINMVTAIPVTTANQYLHVLVYKSTASRIAVTYKPEGGSQSSDNWQSNNTTDSWIDYVISIPVGTNLKVFAIKIGDDAGVYYFDQIRLSDNPNSLTKTPISIDPAIKYQTFEGWGGSLCWWANIMGGYSDSKIKTICDWITDPTTGLNMNIFRFNIGGGDDPSHSHLRGDGGNMPGYKASATSTYNWTQDANQRKILQQLIASRVAKTGVNDIQIVGFSNSPPYWMTVSGCSAGSVEGNVTNLKTDMYDDFADYLTEVVRYYHDNLGITFNYVEPFNEPDGTWWKALGNQEGCYFTTNDQMKMIRELYSKLTDKNMLSYCKITANDANNIDNGYNTLVSYKNAGDIVPKIDLVSVHSYGGSKRNEVYNWSKTNNKKLWQSESGPLNVGGTNEYQFMVMSDRIITDIRDMKCSAWIDWQLAADNSPIWGLIVGAYSNIQNPIERAMSYYIRAQYSRYIKPGYKIIYSSAQNCLAAVSPDEKELVIVVSNKEAITQSFNFDLSKFGNLGRVKQIRTRAQASFGVRNSETFFNTAGNTFSYNALSESVTTFVIPINQAASAIPAIESNQPEFYYYSGYLYLNNSISGYANVNIYDLKGLHIKEMNNLQFGMRYPLQLPKGMYVLNANYEGSSNGKKIIVL